VGEFLEGAVEEIGGGVGGEVGEGMVSGSEKIVLACPVLKKVYRLRDSTGIGLQEINSS